MHRLPNLNPKKVGGLDTGRLGLWNPANLMTFSRLLIGIFVIIAVELGALSVTTGVILVAIAAASDFDGKIARALKCDSDFGRVLDPITDKLFLAIVGTWSLLYVGWVAPLQAILLFVHFIISLKTLHTTPMTSIHAERLGKWAMAWTLMSIVLALTVHLVIEPDTFAPWYLLSGSQLLIAVILSVLNYQHIFHKAK